MKRKAARPTSMADIVDAVHADEQARDAQRQKAAGAEESTLRQVEVAGCTYTVNEDELSPEEALKQATQSRLVVWDACGCGGGCGFDIWQGSRVSALTAAGIPFVDDGSLWLIEGDDGIHGVLVEESVRWGDLH